MALSSRPRRSCRWRSSALTASSIAVVRVRHREHARAAALADAEHAQQDAGAVGDVDRQPRDGGGGDAGGKEQHGGTFLVPRASRKRHPPTSLRTTEARGVTAAGLANNDGDDAGGAARHERCGERLHGRAMLHGQLEAADDAVQASRPWRRAPGRTRRSPAWRRWSAAWRPRPARRRRRTARRPRRPRRCRCSARCASALIWCTAVAISLDAAGDVLDGERRWPRTPRGSARRWRRRRRCGGRPRRRRRRRSAVSAWISPIRLEIWPAARLGLLGQLADFLGDDGEAAALLAGAGGLDRGVEREQVGLLGDAGDRGRRCRRSARTCWRGPPWRCRLARRTRRPRGWRRWPARRRGRRPRRRARACSAASAVARGGLGAGGRRRGRPPGRPRGWTRPCAPGARRPGRRR